MFAIIPMLRNAAIAQLVEHMLGKHEVSGPNPDSSSNKKKDPNRGPFSSCLGLLSARRTAARVGQEKKTKKQSLIGVF